MKTLLLSLAMLCLQIAAANTEVEIRITEEATNNGQVYAAIEILPKNSSLVLADQNYRLYYDASALAFDLTNSNSYLPTDKYGDLDVAEHIEGVNAHRGQLAFDQNLGFINFSITLNDYINGGIQVSNDGWFRVATIAFDKINDTTAEVVWSRENATEQYATAFVQLTEWVAPQETEAIEIVEYTDVAFSAEAPAAISMQVGPNPTADFVRVYIDAPQKANMTIRMVSTSGAVVAHSTLDAGRTMAQVDMANLPSGMYSLLITDANGKQLMAEQISKTNF